MKHIIKRNNISHKRSLILSTEYVNLFVDPFNDSSKFYRIINILFYKV